MSSSPSVVFSDLLLTQCRTLGLAFVVSLFLNPHKSLHTLATSFMMTSLSPRACHLPLSSSRSHCLVTRSLQRNLHNASTLSHSR